MLYQFHKIPKITSTTLIYLNVKELMAVEQNNLNLYYFNNSEITNCIYYKNTLTCHPLNPIFNYNTNKCEIKILKNITKNDCKKANEPLKSYWISINKNVNCL